MPTESATPPVDPDALRAALEDDPYHRALGLVVEAIEDDTVRLALPYHARNSNPGGVLHGGVAASLLAIGSRAVAERVLAGDAGPLMLGQLQVNYLSAAREEDVVAIARRQRRGRALCFVETTVATGNGKPIAAATAVVRARFGADPAPRPATFGTVEGSDPGPLGPIVEQAPFMAGREMHIEHMQGGVSRVTMPASDVNRDAAGALHEGAILALLDTTGAMAAWAEAGPGRFKASTASLQAQSLAPPTDADVVGHGRCIHRDGEMYWSDAEVAEASTGRVLCRGTVFYRLAD